jgi:hypothetical protein
MVLRRLLVALLSALVTTEAEAATAAAKAPFFMFTTWQFPTADEAGALGAVLRRHTRSDDYLGVNVAMQFPDLAGRISRTHVYALPPSVAAVERATLGKCGVGAGLIIYDGEHWQQTPPDEQADMAKAIDRGKTIVHQSGCQDYGIAPDGRYIGISSGACRYDPAKSIHRAIDWTGITLFDIQAQRLIGPNCIERAGVAAYVAVVRSIASDVRERSSVPKIVAQLSFRLTAPDKMIAAIKQLSGIVDGFYIAYPNNVGPPCSYCSAAHLDQVLQAIHQ